MKIPITVLGIAAAVAVAGCSGAQVALPRSTQAVRHGTLAIRSRGQIAMHHDTGRSWMSTIANNVRLLYISDAGNNKVFVYTLPGRKLAGTLTGFDQPQGECSDSAGNVFVTNTERSQIIEYAHGGTKPIKRLEDRRYYPVGCSVDPTTGDLAVTNLFATDGKYGSVAIYRNASGNPTQQTDSSIYYYFFCGYDRRGNLYFDGYTPNDAFAFAELPGGSSTFENIALNQTIYYPGMVQWDGKYITVGDQEFGNHSILYEFTIRGSEGFLEDKTPLTGSADVVQAWIQDGTVYGPDAERTDVGFYHYRAGGTPYKTLVGFSLPIGSTVSE